MFPQATFYRALYTRTGRWIDTKADAPHTHVIWNIFWALSSVRRDRNYSHFLIWSVLCHLSVILDRSDCDKTVIFLNLRQLAHLMLLVVSSDRIERELHSTKRKLLCHPRSALCRQTCFCQCHGEYECAIVPNIRPNFSVIVFVCN